MRQATNESQKTPEDFTEAAKAFRSAVNALRIRHDYTLFNISNMDQTMVRMTLRQTGRTTWSARALSE
ncbi:hypothetical protein HPB50_023387 [Hyalomma asiaticum]|uniref:Uncharacterized protein n=1 Tax=Hyalomma asiaticum TaxID=266040 RepID=A0ACB7S5S0_HYAAI|nr:hypothetical protein HPB50_023387 [Hyalomma asiaticum]